MISISSLLLSIGIPSFSDSNIWEVIGKAEYEIEVPFIPEERIKAITNDLLVNACNEKFETIKETSIESIANYLKNKYGVNIVVIDDLGRYFNGEKILAKATKNPPLIYIDSAINSDVHRKRFTIAHEIGHFILHSEITLFGNIDTDTSINGGFYISDKNLKNMEIQANKFAANLLMPEGVV